MMQMKISRSFRKPFIKFDNDATSCFDRIIPSTAMLFPLQGIAVATCQHAGSTAVPSLIILRLRRTAPAMKA
jgi:hypothetical protein